MVTRSLGMVLALAAASTATAGSRIGVGAGLAADLADPASASHTRFAVGPSLLVPVSLGLGEYAAFRANLRADLATGRDRVTWAVGDQRTADDDHFAMLASAGLTLGAEVTFARGTVQPFLVAAAGPAWVGTFHSFSGPTAVLLDPAQNDLANSGNVDPATSQLVLAYEAALGARTDGPVAPWLEAGFSNAWVGERDLRKTPPASKARRSAYGWNALRLAVGIGFEL
ncbi:MAG: hypothetical protein ACI9K2_003291 [Myxococcota bacterium]|jgi:hypothetical protein